MPHTLLAIHELVGGELEGDGKQLITGVSTLEQAAPGQAAFAEHDRYVPQVTATQASVIIVAPGFPSLKGKTLLRVDNPRAAFLKLLQLFAPAPSIHAGIHATAVVSPQATLAPDVTVGECAVIREEARIGSGTIVDSGVHIGRGVAIGERCRIGPNVVLMDGVRLGDRVIIHGGSVIGGDGFGYVWVEDRHVKIPQLGTVVIEDDVEIGCNVCVDRATLGSTLIRRGTKIDNLVQIAHNDVIGEYVSLTGQVGLSGSVTVGNRAMFGGQAGVVDHITIGENARIGAATPVTKDVRAGETVWGFPARPAQRTKRELASLAQLPKLLPRVRDLLAQLRALQSRVGTLERKRAAK